MIPSAPRFLSGASAAAMLAMLLAVPAPVVHAQSQAMGEGWALTRPERTDYRETSRYDEVVAYMQQMAAANPKIHLTTYGYTYEGRPLPLAVIGAPGASPEEVLATGKTRIYIQANIHGGEVEGKEAMLQMLRSIARGERDAWFESTVLLINPIYNADGNERINLTNRGSQAGPFGGMGTRENAQQLDLNRDGMKMETAEARSMASLLTRYQPHMAMDLHTTDGSGNSGFNMTYETSLNPNNSKAEMDFLRGELLPLITKNVREKHGSYWWYYGGVSGTGDNRAWRSDADLARPRYTSTYYGVRNILGLLTEAYSYSPLKTRIEETYWFVEEVVDHVSKNGPRIRALVDAANKESVIGRQLAVRQELVRDPRLREIASAESKLVRHPYVPDRPYRVRTDEPIITEMLPFYGMTEPTETSLAPRVWVIPNTPGSAAPAAPPAGAPGAPGGAPGFIPGQIPAGGGGFGFGPRGAPFERLITTVKDRLDSHGVSYSVTTKEMAFNGERYKIESNTLAPREYQGAHKARTLTGAWEGTQQTLPVGSLIIRMDQPLARLLFILMDPRSDDGFMWWNILDAVLGQTPAPEYYPVFRSMNDIRG